MSRYFFTTQDGVAVNDPVGAECADLDAVRDQAVQRAATMLHQQGADFWRDPYWRLSVADDRGLTLFSIEVSATLAPAISG